MHRRPADPPCIVDRAPGRRTRLVLDKALMFREPDRGGPDLPPDARRFALDRLWQDNRPVYLVAIDADDAWMVRVQRRSAP